MLKQVFAIGLLGALGFASVGAAASDYGYHPAPPPAVYVRPAYHPRYVYPRAVYYPRYAPRGWYGVRYRSPAAPRYGHWAPAPRYWDSHPQYQRGHGTSHWNGHGNDHGGRGDRDHH